ncbi:hypothetical protein MRX96_050289 [Rhipicephalus microplus]
MQPQMSVLQAQHLGILPQHMQGPTPAMFQPKSSGGPDGALLFKERAPYPEWRLPCTVHIAATERGGWLCVRKRPASSQWHARANPAAPFKPATTTAAIGIGNLPELVI